MKPRQPRASGESRTPALDAGAEAIDIGAGPRLLRTVQFIAR